MVLIAPVTYLAVINGLYCLSAVHMSQWDVIDKEKIDIRCNLVSEHKLQQFRQFQGTLVSSAVSIPSVVAYSFVK